MEMRSALEAFCSRKKRKNVSHLHKKDVSGGVGASVDNKGLLFDVSTSTGPDGQLTTVLHTKMNNI